jgi:hypothetical protein
VPKTTFAADEVKFSALKFFVELAAQAQVLDPGAICHFDLGALCYGIVLAAWDRGLGTVVNGQGIMRSDIVREVAQIPGDQVIMTCVAMGYPDDEFPVNAVRSDRRPNDNYVQDHVAMITIGEISRTAFGELSLLLCSMLI